MFYGASKLFFKPWLPCSQYNINVILYVGISPAGADLLSDLSPGVAIASTHTPKLDYSGNASFTVVHKNHLLFPGLSFTFIYPIGSWKLGK